MSKLILVNIEYFVINLQLYDTNILNYLLYYCTPSGPEDRAKAFHSILSSAVFLQFLHSLNRVSQVFSQFIHPPPPGFPLRNHPPQCYFFILNTRPASHDYKEATELTSHINASTKIFGHGN